MTIARSQEVYIVDNVTFCSDADLYPTHFRQAGLTLNHVPADGTILVDEHGEAQVDLRMPAGDENTLQYLIRNSAFRPINLHRPSLENCADLRVTLESAEFETYGHTDPTRRTFDFQIPNGPRTNALYRVHTRRGM